MEIWRLVELADVIERRSAGLARHVSIPSSRPTSRPTPTLFRSSVDDNQDFSPCSSSLPASLEASASVWNFRSGWPSNKTRQQAFEQAAGYAIRHCEGHYTYMCSLSTIEARFAAYDIT